MIQRAADGGGVAINAIIYAEVSVRFETIEEVNLVLPSDYFLRAVIPWEAAFLAGKAFDAYKRRGGARRSPLPDFFIGAHAAVSGMTLLTPAIAPLAPIVGSIDSGSTATWPSAAAAPHNR